MNETLAERIKYLRQIRAQATQDELAAVMQTKRSRVADIERGKVNELKANEAVKIASHYKIDGWWLMTGEGEAEPLPFSKPAEDNNTESGIFPHNIQPGIAADKIMERMGDVEFTFFKVESNRYEPLIPQGATLLLEEHTLYRDGDFLLIESDHGLYIKQYHIELGQNDGDIVLKTKDEENRIPLAVLEANGGIVKGRVTGYLQIFNVD